MVLKQKVSVLDLTYYITLMRRGHFPFLHEYTIHISFSVQLDENLIRDSHM